MIKFRQFEKATELLEQYTLEEIKDDSEILETAGLDESIISHLEKLNEGFLGGLLDKLKNALSKHIPGGTLRRVEAELKTYKNNMEDALEQELKLRKTVLGEKGGKEGDEGRRAKFDRQMERVNDKLDEYKARAEEEFYKMTKGQPDRIKNYINMRIAELQAEVSKQELDSALKNAELYTEKEQDRIKKEQKETVEKVKATEEEAKASAEAAEKKKKDREDKKKKKNFYKELTKDSEWVYKKDNGDAINVKIADEPAKEDERVYVYDSKKTDKQKFDVNMDRLTKKEGEEKEGGKVVDLNAGQKKKAA